MLRIADQHFTCRQCGRCCHLPAALSPLELEAIAKLPWPAGSQPPRDYYAAWHGQPFLKRDAATRACVYLDERNHCRMHAAFGGQCKPLTCRAYPLEFLRTFGDEVTVAARFDCPAVLAGDGPALASRRAELEALASEVRPHLGRGFTDTECDGLSPDAIRHFTAFLAARLSDGAAPEALIRLAADLHRLGAAFINDIETLDTVLPSMFDKAARTTAATPLGATWPHRTNLRRALLDCLRRDDPLDGTSLGTRLRRALHAAAVMTGGGNAARFSPDNPDFPIRQARLFDQRRWPAAPPETFAVHRRFLAVRLDTLQFFGSANHSASFFDGLEQLLRTCDTALALARLHAAACHRDTPSPEDTANTTALIDHAFGRAV